MRAPNFWQKLLKYVLQKLYAELNIKHTAVFQETLKKGPKTNCFYYHTDLKKCTVRTGPLFLHESYAENNFKVTRSLK